MKAAKTFPDVSVVVPAHNEERFLPLCLESLKKQDYQGSYEVIVVDNASTDNTAGVALMMGAKVVYEGKKSSSCARQRGLEEAKGEIVAFIDADTKAPSYWLSAIVDRFTRDAKTVVVSGPYAYFDAGTAARIASYIGNFINICLDHLFRRCLNKGGALWGCNFAVRRQVLLAAGGFDTNIRFLGDDYAVSLRLKNKGGAGLMPALFVLTSARRLKEQGYLNTYCNWVVGYFSVLFWSKPIPERLENLPQKAWMALVASYSVQKYRQAVKYSVLLLVFLLLLWVNAGPLGVLHRKPLFMVEIILLAALLIYHGTSPSSQFYGRVYSHGNRRCGQIALTFDDGPNEPYTSQVLNILRRYGIKATFFVVGQNVKRYPQVCRRVLAEGNAIGNHSYHHYKLLWLKWGKDAAHEINLAEEAVSKATGYRVKLFRPPYGYRTPWFIHTVRRLGYTVITWDDMTNDWEADKPAHDIVKAIVGKVKPGSIIVLHDGRSGKENYDRSQMLHALPEIIEKLQKKGFDFVTVPQLVW